jgi:polyhydroxyalkanoate synthesis regulator phasin
LFKKTLMTFAAFLLIGLPVALTPLAYAQTPGNTPQPNFFQGLIQFISQKFGLSQDQVKSAVSDYQAQKKQDNQKLMQDRKKKRLDILVSQGKITADQETAIINELNSLQSKYGNQTNLTPAQRKQNMQNRMNDLKTWAAQQGIDLSLIMPGPGKGGPKSGSGKRFGMGMGRWNKPSASPSATP